MIKVGNVSKIYKNGHDNFYALRNVSLRIKDGEFAAILGPSGSGKSTLMHLIGGLDKPTHGKVIVNDQDLSGFSDQKMADFRNREIGFIFQFFNLIPRLGVYDNVALPLVYSRNQSETVSSRNKFGDDKERVKKLLSSVGLEHKVRSKVVNLSGGEAQRVAICRALVNDPDIILADEPTGNLDSKNGREIFKILNSLKEKGKTVVLVTHDESLAKIADQIIRIRDGEIE